MTTQVIEITNTTNLIEIVNLPTQLISEVISNIVSETTNQINVVEVNTTSLVITSSTTSRELVEVPTTTNVIEPVVTTTQVISETIPVLYGEEEVPYSKRTDFISENLLYRGEAAPGSLPSDAAWRIRKITIAVDGDVTEQWADGNGQFTKVWDNRLSLTYI